MVTDVFLDWESYQFRTEEIDAVFHGAVWPQVNLDFFIWPRYLLLLPLLNIHLSLFFYIKPLFLAVLEHFSLPPLPPKAQELVSAVPWHLYLRLIWLWLCLLSKCNITFVAPHMMCLWILTSMREIHRYFCYIFPCLISLVVITWW